MQRLMTEIASYLAMTIPDNVMQGAKQSKYIVILCMISSYIYVVSNGIVIASPYKKIKQGEILHLLAAKKMRLLQVAAKILKPL
jgi:hypothetical protein